jgi:cation transporter-like permease
LARKQADLIFSVVLLAIVSWMTWEALKWDRRAGLFPLAIGVPASALCLLQLGFAARAVLPARVRGQAAEGVLPDDGARRRTAEIVGWILIMTMGIVLLGFELGSAVISFAFLRFAAHETVRISVGVSVLTYLFFYVIFDRALNIPFPPGLLTLP